MDENHMISGYRKKRIEIKEEQKRKKKGLENEISEQKGTNILLSKIKLEE